jgi:parallel beta-helix repeat protein
MILNQRAWLGVFLGALVAGCNGYHETAHSNKGSSEPAKNVAKITPGSNVQKETQEALIKAKPGSTIEFGEGKFEYTMGLSLTAEGVTIRGQGMDKTILSFKKQDAGKEGLLVNRGNLTIEDLTVEDTKGDAIKVNGGDGVTFRRVRTQWTEGEKESNGAYGLYPVQCKNVLIEECVAIGASDAGIYVGQSQNVIVRKCKAEKNVAGIEIENCIDADAYDNIATNNAGGILVFDLPGLEQKNGKRVRVFNNQVIANNHANFAPKGNIVASVGPGTGMTVMATDEVELFNNVIQDNETFSLSVISFYITGRPLEDKNYDPIPEGIYIHDNKITGGGKTPAGERGLAMAALLGTPMPDIIYDGIRNKEKMVDGKVPANLGVYFKNNGSATFANLHWNELNPMDLKASAKKIERDPKPFEGELPALPEVKLASAQ